MVFRGQFDLRGSRDCYRRDGDRGLFVVDLSQRGTCGCANGDSHPVISLRKRMIT